MRWVPFNVAGGPWYRPAKGDLSYGRQRVELVVTPDMDRSRWAYSVTFRAYNPGHPKNEHLRRPEHREWGWTPTREEAIRAAERVFETGPPREGTPGGGAS